MNILFLSLGKYWTINEHEINTDLLREFIKHGDKVYILSPIERRENRKAEIIREKNSTIIKVNIGNIQKTNIIEKGISTLLIEYQFLNAIKKFLSDVTFDLVLYPTPPITFVKCVEYIKKRDHAKTYLMLKDIFPQNAVDIGMMKKSGVKGLLYRYFRNKERKLYSISDRIGCMSQANVDYILMHNTDIDSNSVEICPNAIEVKNFAINSETKAEMRMKYGLPLDKKILIYGGNLGKPQGVPFIIECIKELSEVDDIYVLIVGDGTEFLALEKFYNESSQDNFKLMKRLPKDDYESMIASCDIGLIFLDYRFTIPNYPSRLLAYMQASLPVIAATDVNSDIGKTICEGGFGWWCESNQVNKFKDIVIQAKNQDLKKIGNKGLLYLKGHFTSSIAYELIKNGLWCAENE